MRVGDAFGSYLKCENLHGKRVLVTIDRVEKEKIGEDQKFVLYFAGKDKGLVLNKTNAESITEIAGTDEMDDWTGHKILLHPDKTKFGGKTVDCIRIAAPNGARPAPAAPPEPVFVEDEGATDDDDLVPF